MIFAGIQEKHHVRVGLRKNINHVWDQEKHIICMQYEKIYINFAWDEAKHVNFVWNEEKYFILAWNQANILLVRGIDATMTFV